MIHSDDCARMSGRDALILEMMQVLHRGVVDNLSRQDDQEIGFGVRGDDERFVEGLVEFHQIHACDRGQINFVGVLHFADGPPNRAG